MIYFILVIVIVSIRDIKYLISKNKKKDLYVYIAFMFLVCAAGILFYSNPDYKSLSRIMLMIVGKDGE